MLQHKIQIFNVKSRVPEAHIGGVLATRNTHTHSNIIFQSFVFFFVTIV